MTIDEAISKFKNITNEDAPCPRYCMRICDECVQESKQIAEWLEELKEIKEKGRYVQGNKAGQKIGYINAIDELMAKVSECFISDSEWNYLVQESERLKAGVENGNL